MKILIFMSLLVFAVPDEKPCCTPSDSSCFFYQCLERLHPCGQRGYNLRVGENYCNKFLKDEESYTTDGKVVLQKTRKCLQERLLKFTHVENCDEVAKMIINEHSACYVESGMCGLPIQDKFRVIKGVGPSALTFSFITEVFDTLNSCAKRRPSP